MSTKKPWQSKTLIGAFLLLLSFGAGSLGAEISPEEQATIVERILEIGEPLAALVGWVMVVLGRVMAKTKVTL